MGDIDWGAAERKARIERTELEVFGPLDEAYRAMHGGRLVEASPGDYLARPVGAPDGTHRVSADDFAELEAPGGVCQWVGEPVVLGEEEAAALLTGLSFGVPSDVGALLAAAGDEPDDEDEDDDEDIEVPDDDEPEAA